MAASAIAGCGYGPAHSGQSGFCVVSGDGRNADAIADSALASGVREGLAASGALGTCPPSRRVRVELVRISSSPIAAVEGEGNAIARGMQITVVGRATAELDDGVWTTESQGETSVAVSHAVASAAQTEADARARAARQAGLGLAWRLTGMRTPSPGDRSAR